jgi:GT2 family glycosyltransferase
MTGSLESQADDPATDHPAIDAVIVAFQSGDTIENCVTGLWQVPGMTQIVVVDHGHDDTAIRAAALGASVLSDSSNPGFGTGQNRGTAVGHSPYVLICNPDTVVAPKGVARGLDVLTARPDVAAVQGAIDERDRDLTQRSSWNSVGALHLWFRILRIGRIVRLGPIRRITQRFGLLPQPSTADRDVEALAAIVLLVRRRAFEEVGGFDPGYFLYWEDIDLSTRLRRHGWRLVTVPEVWAVHADGGSSSDAFERERQWWRGCMRYTALWYGRMDWAAALGAAAVQWATMAVRKPHLAGALWHDLIGASVDVRRRNAQVPV